MSDQIKDGAPAFPGQKEVRFGQTNDCNEGMTLRDYFAIHATDSDITPFIDLGYNTDVVVEDGDGQFRMVRTKATRTREQARYAFASAMLKARGES